MRRVHRWGRGRGGRLRAVGLVLGLVFAGTVGAAGVASAAPVRTSCAGIGCIGPGQGPEYDCGVLVAPPMLAEYRLTGNSLRPTSDNSWLGCPLTEAYGSSYRMEQEFQNGFLEWSPATGAHAMAWGPVYDMWRQRGGQDSTLGQPTTDLMYLPDGQGQGQMFANGAIYSSPATGTHFILGLAIKNAWGANGYETGWLGYPTSDTAGNSQRFQYGQITTQTNGTTTTAPDARQIDGFGLYGYGNLDSNAHLTEYADGQWGFFGNVQHTANQYYANSALGVAQTSSNTTVCLIAVHGTSASALRNSPTGTENYTFSGTSSTLTTDWRNLWTPSMQTYWAPLEDEEKYQYNDTQIVLDTLTNWCRSLGKTPIQLTLTADPA